MGRGNLRSKVMALCAALSFGLLALACSPSWAGADLQFCPPGEGAGQCGTTEGLNAQRGLGVDSETGHLYVADEANNRIDVFAEDGAFLFAFGWKVNATTPEEKLQACTTVTGCQKGSTGPAAGQFDRPTEVAVDNDPLSPSHHDVYVADSRNLRVQKFDPAGEFIWTVGKEVDKTDHDNLCTKVEAHPCGVGVESETEGGFATPGIFVAVGPGGVLYGVDNVRLPGDMIKQRLQRFQPDGTLISPQTILFEGHVTLVFAIAVDSIGNVWVSSQLEGLRKYSPNGTLLVGPIDSTTGFRLGLAIDAGDNVYAAQEESSFQTIAAYDSAGNHLGRFAYSKPSNLASSYNGLAVHPSAFGQVFFSIEKAGIEYVSLPPPGPIAPPQGMEVKNLGSAKATAVAEVNPEGEATKVHFAYLSQADYVKQGESFIGPATKETPTIELNIPAGREFNLNTAEALLGCPNPASEAGEPGKCLIPETTYRLRVIATNADGEGTGETTFTTKPSPQFGEIYTTRVGSDTARLSGEVNPNSLPTTGYFEYIDEASYQKDLEEGGDGFATAIKAPDPGAGQAPLSFGAGEAFVTRSVSLYPLEHGSVYHYRLVAQNQLVGPVASESEALETFEPPEVDSCPANQASRIGPGAFLPDCRAYEMVSPLDKAGGDIRVLATLLGPLAVLEQSSTSGNRLVYGSARSFGDALSAPYTSQYLAQRVEGKAWETHSINPPRGEPLFGGASQLDNEFKAFSADVCEGWLTTLAEPPLSEGALAKFSNLYRRTDRLCSEDGEDQYEALAPLSKPGGVPVDADFDVTLRGVSADGVHAIFTANGRLATGGSSAGARQLYESVRGEGVRFVCFLPGGAPVNGPCTSGSDNVSGFPAADARAISADGERIFWSPGSGESKIYVRSGGTQTVAVSKAAEEIQGTSKSWFWGAAEDGSRAIISTGNAEATLYSYELEGGVTTPIAEGVRGVMGMSADGKRIYFASRKVLAPGAVAGGLNLYLYDGTGGGVTKFVATLANGDLDRNVANNFYFTHSARVSPDGAHAAFVSAAPLTGYDNAEAAAGDCAGGPCTEVYLYDADGGRLICASCNPSGARPAGLATTPAYETAMQGPRVLSEDGSRLFFESGDALAARDSNGRTDVYEWEEEGAGGCGAGDASFSVAAEGCVDLISSGQSPQDTRFIEASPSGDDVFFATVASLLPQDFGVFDVYDARVDGGLPIPPPPAPPCEGDACSAQIPAPQEATPASSDYVGPPEASPAAKRPRCAKGKRRESRKGKSRCVPKSTTKRRRAVR